VPDQASAMTHDPAGDAAVQQAVLHAAFRVLAETMQPRQAVQVPAAGGDGRDDLPPLLAPGQVAKLIGVSRNTVDRMVADGELPSVVLRRGARQQMVRIPKAFVLQLLRDLNSGARVSLREYAAQWSASIAAGPATEVGEVAS
jgi:excisionase family DNA binding protein